MLATVQSQDVIRLNAERTIAQDTLQFTRKKMEQERALWQKRVSPEIDYINGAVARLGKENHIPAPVNEFVTNLIHSKESQLNAQ